MAELRGRVSAPLEIVAKLVGTGPMGPPGKSPRVGENGNWWVGDADTGVPAAADLAPLSVEELEELLQ